MPPNKPTADLAPGWRPSLHWPPAAAPRAAGGACETAQAPAAAYPPKAERSLRTQLLELLLFTVSGGILIVVLDIAVRLGMLLERRRGFAA